MDNRNLFRPQVLLSQDTLNSLKAEAAKEGKQFSYFLTELIILGWQLKTEQIG